MGCGRVFLCIIFPPLAVLDKGCGSVLIVTLLTLCGGSRGTEHGTGGVEMRNEMRSKSMPEVYHGETRRRFPADMLPFRADKFPETRKETDRCVS